MKTLTILLALTATAAAQPAKFQDRHPTYADSFDGRWEANLKGRPTDTPVRTIRIDPKDAPTRPIPGSHPVLSGDLVRGRAVVDTTPVPAGWPVPPPAQNSPTGLSEAVGIVPVPGNRLRHDPIRPQTLASVGADVCSRHGKRKVWQGRSWRCR